MSKKQYKSLLKQSTQLIIDMLKEERKGVDVASLCEKYDISVPTFYRYKKYYSNKYLKTYETEEEYLKAELPKNLNEVNIAMGRRLAEIRMLLNLKQNYLAVDIGTTSYYISKAETGEIPLTADRLFLLYTKHNVNPNYIILGYLPKFIANSPSLKENTKTNEILFNSDEDNL